MADEKLLDRVPPHNLEAEQSVLGSLLIDKDAMIRIGDIVKPEDFYRDAHMLIFRSMRELFDRREPIDLLSLTNILEGKSQLEQIGGRTYLAMLANIVPTAANVANYAQIVQRKATLRKLITTASEMVALGFKEDEDPTDLLDQAEQKLFSVSQGYLKQNFVPIQEALSETFERIDELHKNKGKIRGITTGFQDLDGLLAGLQRSDLVVLAARPSMGKTSLALDIARNAALKGYAVGIFSLEMSKDQIIDRFLSSQGGVDLWKIRTGNLSERENDNDFERIGAAMAQLSEAPIFIDDSAILNVMEIRTKARRLQMEHGLDLLVIDYLQLMEGSKQNQDNRVQEVAQITRGLKGIARELNIPVLSLSQLSRAVEMRSPPIPKLADLRESGCLSGDTIIINADTGKRMRLADMVGKKNIPVFSMTVDLKVKKVIVSNVFSSGKKQTFALQTRSGRTIKASTNHQFLTINGWKRLDMLSLKEFIALPRLLETRSRSPLSRNELILLAHLIGDGCVLPHQPIHYTSADKKNIDVVGRLAKKLFHIEPRVVKQKNWFHVYLPSPYHLTHGKKNPITRWYEKLDIKPVRSYEKKLPESLFSCSKDDIALFLHHLWATDGNISWKLLRGRKSAGAIYYSTASNELASQVQHLLLRLGILSTVRTVPQKKKNKTYRPNYTVHIQSAEQQIAFCEQVGCAGERGNIIPTLINALRKIENNPNNDKIPKGVWQSAIQPEKEKMEMSWREFSQKIDTAYCGDTLFKHGVSRQRMLRVATALKSETLTALATSDIYWDEIVSITDLGIEEVYDATVPKTHNFIANDIIVHNSIEQDSDVVMFIYREDYYKRDTQRRNVTDIFIAKHRNGPTGKIELYFDDARVTFKTLDKQYAHADSPPPSDPEFNSIVMNP